MTHPYAEILIAIANREEIEFDCYSHGWGHKDIEDVLVEIANEAHPPQRYRVKPRTIRIGEFDVPEPVREPLEKGTKYWTFTPRGVIDYVWEDDDTDMECLASGWIHLTKEAAETHRRALVSFTKRGEA